MLRWLDSPTGGPQASRSSWLQVVGGMAYLVSLSRFLSVTTAVVCCAMGGVMFVAGRYQQVAARVVQDTLAKANEVAEESFSLAKMVRTFGTESQEAAR